MDRSLLFPTPCSLLLEVVRHAHGGHEDVEPLVGGQVGGARTTAGAERWHLGHPAAVFSADVEAGTDLIGKTRAVEATHLGLLLGVDQRGARVANGQKDQRS